MGKATIINHIAEAQYNVMINFDRARSDTEIARLETENTALAIRIAELAGEINTAALDVDNAKDVLRASITNFKSGLALQADVDTAMAWLQDSLNLYQNLTQVRAISRLKKVTNEKRIAWLNDMVPIDVAVTAWCADYTDGLSGAVGMIDIGRQAGTNIIRAGGANGDAAGYDVVVDGKYEGIASGTPAGVFFNLALKPAVEKWRPRYRTGVISALDLSADTAGVTLDPAVGEQGIIINQTQVLVDVAVQYMTCNASAFTVGDHVIIEFIGMDWTTPQVVGFVDNPKVCYGWVLADVAFSAQTNPEGMGRYEMTDMLVLTDPTRPAGAIVASIDDILVGSVPTVEPTGAEPTTVPISLYRANRSGLDVRSAAAEGYWYYGNHPYPDATRPGVIPPPGIAPILPNPDRVISWPNMVDDRRPNYWTGRLRTYKWQAPMTISCTGNVGTIVNGTSFSVKNGTAPYTWSITMESPLPATHPACLVADDPDGWTATIIAPTTYELPVGQGAVVCTDANGASVAVEVAFGDFSVAIPTMYDFQNTAILTMPQWDWQWPGLDRVPVGSSPPWQNNVVYLSATNDSLIIVWPNGMEGTNPVTGEPVDGYSSHTVATGTHQTGLFFRLVSKPAGNVKQVITENWWSDNSTAEHPLPAGFEQTRIPGSDVDATGLVLAGVTAINIISQP